MVHLTTISDTLPEGWLWTKLEEISEIILGQSPPSSTYNTDGEGLPFYQGKLEFGKLYPTPRKWCTAPKKIAEKGTFSFLFARLSGLQIFVQKNPLWEEDSQQSAG